MPGTGKWTTTEDVFLIRNPEVKWNTGRPTWSHWTIEGVAWVEKKYAVTVNLEEIE
jgi:hypothetical protein